MVSTAPLQPEIHSLRGHAGQIESAAFMRELLAGSEIRESHVVGDQRVQDPYCIRCQPQVTGAAMDVLRQAACTLEIEADGATEDRPKRRRRPVDETSLPTLPLFETQP